MPSAHSACGSMFSAELFLAISPLPPWLTQVFYTTYIHNYKCASLLNHQGIHGPGLQAHSPLNMPSRWCWSSVSTSAAAVMVDPSAAWDALFARRRPRLDRLGASLPIDLGGSFSSSRLQPPLHLSWGSPLPSIELHTVDWQQRCATWWRGSTPSGEPVGEPGLLLSALVVGVEEGVLRRCSAAFRSPSPRRRRSVVLGHRCCCPETQLTPLLPTTTRSGG
jgi:hypothetical protein